MNDPKIVKSLENDLTEILGEPTESQHYEGNIAEYVFDWKNGKQWFRITVYSDGEIVRFAGDGTEGGSEYYANLTYNSAIEHAREWGEQCH